MPQPRTLLLIVFGALTLLALGVLVLVGMGDASVVAATSGVQGVLELSDLGDDAELRTRLFAVVMNLKAPWAIVHYAGLAFLALSAIGLVTAWRLPK